MAGVLEVARALAPSVPVVLMCYANMVLARGAEAFVERLAAAGVCGLIVPDLPLRGGRRRCSRRATRAGVALVPLVAPTTPDERLAEIGARARGFLYTVSVDGTTGERDALDEASPRSSRGRGRTPTCRWRVGLRHLHARAGRRGGRTPGPTA